ncbi:hypothetical protein [Ensifer sp. ZNC0028]|uniref:hypothetical protein n=1 Tax=Ensifer sp. ZNC0028 TaxID=1339236 RepID=UPI0012E0680D|nr:hypothetical protein [Ensifer sp. ZNC0028]
MAASARAMPAVAEPNIMRREFVFAIKGIGKMITSIGGSMPKPPISSFSPTNLTSLNPLSKALSASLGGVGPLATTPGLISRFSSLDLAGNKALAANPALRDALLGLQKQTAAGSAKAVTNAYSKF